MTRSSMSKNILILGTGALATLFAARLTAAGASVTILGTWHEALAAFNQRGAIVEGEPAQAVRAVSDPTECPASGLALVLVKSYQTGRAALQLADCLQDGGLAVSLQNGLGNADVLTQALNQQGVATGITTLGATLLDPGIVSLAGAGPLWLEQHPFISPLANWLQEAGFLVELVGDIRPRVWGKLVVNAAINPLTALLRVKNGDLLSDPLAHSLMGRLAREAAFVAKASGIVLPFLQPENAADEVAEQTKDNYSSMLRDVLRGAPTEVDSINGEVVHRGEAYGVEVPVNRKVWKLVGKQSRLSSAELSDMVR